MSAGRNYVFYYSDLDESADTNLKELHSVKLRRSHILLGDRGLKTLDIAREVNIKTFTVIRSRLFDYDHYFSIRHRLYPSLVAAVNFKAPKPSTPQFNFFSKLAVLFTELLYFFDNL